MARLKTDNIIDREYKKIGPPKIIPTKSNPIPLLLTWPILILLKSMLPHAIATIGKPSNISTTMVLIIPPLIIPWVCQRVAEIMLIRYT